MLCLLLIASMSFPSGGLLEGDLAEAQQPVSDRRQTWYGAQTIVADGAALILGGYGAVKLATDDGFAGRGSGLPVTGLKLGLAVFAIGTPLLHAIHGHPARALGSLAMRVALPLAGALLLGIGGCGNAAGPCLSSGTGAYAGALAGALAAMAIDAGQSWDSAPLGAGSRAAIALGGRSASLAFRF